MMLVLGLMALLGVSFAQDTAHTQVLVPGILTTSPELLPITVVVKTSQSDPDPQIYSTYVVKGGILLGGLYRLMYSSEHFKFTYSQDPDLGVYLESVNGLAGCKDDRTYWQLQVKTPDGQIIVPNVGIGCYIPKANYQIILKYQKW